MYGPDYRVLREYVERSNIEFENTIDCTSSLIFRRMITAYAVVKINEGNVIKVASIPITDYDYFFSQGTEVEGEIIGIVAPTCKSFIIYGNIPDQSVTFNEFINKQYDNIYKLQLGIEYEGIPHHDWVNMYILECVKMIIF